MAGTDERRKSIVDEGWEPMKPTGQSAMRVVAIFAAALVIIPLVAFFASYALLSR
jgi:hypothetical protein